MIRVASQICVTGAVELLQSAVIIFRKWPVVVLFLKKIGAAGVQIFLRRLGVGRIGPTCRALIQKKKIRRGLAALSQARPGR